MMKHWYIISVSALLAVVAIVGTVFALMRKDTPKLENEFVPANVSCEVYETLTYAGSPQYVEQHADVRIKNTGNIDAYLRIRFVSYWVKYNPETTSWEISAKSSVMPELHIASGWVKSSTSDTYYYPTPVNPETFTPYINTAPIVLQKDGDYVQVLEVFAEAIQSLPNSAVTGSWNVTLGTDGVTIISAN